MRIEKSSLITTLALSACMAGSLFGADKVASSAKEVRPSLIGAETPAVEYKRTDGSGFDLRKESAKKPIVLIYYRGGW